MFKFQSFPVFASNNDVVMLAGRITGGGAAANCTITAGLRGVASVNYRSATGKYTVTFNDVPEGSFLGMWGLGGGNADTAADAKVANYVAGTYSASNKTLSITVQDLATPTLTDLGTDEELALVFLFSRSAKP